VPVVVVDRVELADDLRDLVGAVEVERDRAVLGDGLRLVEGVRRERAARVKPFTRSKSLSVVIRLLSWSASGSAIELWLPW
jgi:hypothetical protein